MEKSSMFSKNELLAALIIGLIIFLVGILGFPWGTLSTQLTTALITVITGVIVLVLGQIVIRFIVEPFQRQQACIEDIAYYLTFYADLWGNPGRDPVDQRTEGSRKIRSLASKLNSISVNRFFYSILVGFDISPSYENLDIAHRELIGLSNGFFAPNGTEARRRSNMNLQGVHEIEEALNLPTNLGIDIEEIITRMRTN